MYQKHRWLWIVTAALCLFAGIFVLMNPVASLASLSILLGIAVLVSGFSQVIFYFSETKELRRGVTLVWGIFSIIVGIWVLQSSLAQLVTLMPFVFAFWVMIGASSRLIFGIELSYEKQKNATTFIVLGIIGIILGIILLYRPVISGIIVNYLVSLVFLYEGVLCLIHFFNKKNTTENKTAE